MKIKYTFILIFCFLIKIVPAQSVKTLPDRQLCQRPKELNEIDKAISNPVMMYIDQTWGKISSGKFYKFSVPPNTTYPDKWMKNGEFTDGVQLTDDKLATEDPLDDSWVGFINPTVSINLDLGKVYSISQLSIHMLSKMSWGIKFPTALQVHVSIDNINWIPYAIQNNFPTNSPSASLMEQASGAGWASARYVRFSLGTDVNTHMFIDEIEVFGTIEHSRKLIPTDKCYFGAYAKDNNGYLSGTVIKDFETLSQRKLRMLLWYADLKASQSYTASITTPIINGAFKNYNDNTTDKRDFLIQIGAQINDATSLQIAQGDFDTQIKTWFTECKAANFPSFIRLLSDMNGSWTYAENAGNAKWGGDPATYIPAWRRIYNIAEQVGATDLNQIFVWSPNAKADYTNTGNNVRQNMENYYPGHQYVDWISTNVYNYNAFNDPFLSVNTQLTRLKNIYGNFKPMMISECGMGETTDPDAKFKWILELHRTINEFNVKACNWYNDSQSGVNLRIDTSPFSLKGYRPYFND